MSWENVGAAEAAKKAAMAAEVTYLQGNESGVAPLEHADAIRSELIAPSQMRFRSRELNERIPTVNKRPTGRHAFWN
jgi:hypothetical protein